MFVGIYDGHNGEACSAYLLERFFTEHLMVNHVEVNKTVSLDVISDAFERTETIFKQCVRGSRSRNSVMAATGSCCLVAVIWRRTIYVANVGDSRAVLVSDNAGITSTESLCEVHSLDNPAIRAQLKGQHPGEPNLFDQKDGVWLIKGRVKVYKSIGDFYLKDPNYAVITGKKGFWGPVNSADLLTAVPAVNSVDLSPNHRFLIFASHGLWERLSLDEAVAMVQEYSASPSGIARRLIHKALRRAARKGKKKFAELKNMAAKKRKRIYDDMTVVVIFIDQNRLNQNDEQNAQGIRADGESVELRDGLLYTSRRSRISYLPEPVVPAGNIPAQGVAAENIPAQGVAAEGIAPEGIVPEAIAPEGIVPEEIVPEE